MSIYYCLKHKIVQRISQPPFCSKVVEILFSTTNMPEKCDFIILLLVALNTLNILRTIFPLISETFLKEFSHYLHTDAISVY